jgi:hypothetical protein
MPTMLRTLALAGALLVLSGCAAINTVAVQVSTFGQWPADRAPGRYAFDRLPSQQAQPDEQLLLENAAAAALAQAGFSPAAGSETPDVLVQLGAGNAHSLRPDGDFPLYWHGGINYWHPRRVYGPSLGLSFWHPLNYSYDRNVALLLRERESGKALLEVRAGSTGYYALDEGLARLMFEAALMDFPRPVPGMRTVRLPQR